jgi:hypothetical protein
VRIPLVFVLLVALIPVSSPSFAQAEQRDLRTSEIAAQQHALRDEINTGSGRYGALSSPTREKILASQDRLFALIDGAATTADLAPEDRKVVFATLDSITAALNDQGEEHVICKREARTGSNYMTRVCRTTRQIRDDEAAGHGRLEEAKRSVCDDKNGCY